MARGQPAYITPSVLTWAIKQKIPHFPIRNRVALAQMLRVSVERVVAWENGMARPTITQVKKIADFLDVPFGYFWLPKPPEERKDMAVNNGVAQYIVMPDEFRVLLELLEDAISRNALSQDQLARLSFDPHDILIDLRDEDIQLVTVMIMREK